jgi:serine/threonine protein kinase
LHLCGIVHRDLKPENILVDIDPASNRVNQIKLTDFGLSKIVVPGEVMYDSCGTPAYVAPEVLMKDGYSKEVDIWSTGVILYTMISRSLPFHSDDRKQTFKLIKEAEPDISGALWQKISAPCKDLLLQMLIKSPKERITIAEALQHPAFVLQGLTSLKPANKNISVEEVENEFDKQLKQQQAQSR